MRKRVKKAVAAVALAAFVAVGITPATGLAGNSIDSLQQQKNEVNSEKKDVQSQINENKKEKQTLTQQLNAINAQLNDVQQTIETLNGEISETEEKIAFTETEIDNKQRDYDGRLAIFNQRLKELYEYGDVDFLEVLLHSSSLSDFLTRFEYLQYIARNDQALLDEVTELKTSLETQRLNLSGLKSDLETKKQTQVDKSKELQTASQQQQALVDQINADQDALFDLLDDLEQESKRLNSEIVRLQAAQKSANTKAPGAYLWPSPSCHIITSNYGYRIHPISGVRKLHSGIDIGAKRGTDVVASASGTVIMSKYNGGYGNCIIIDHGGGVATLYGHMSSLIAHTGQQVTAGQVIGKVGSTGSSTAPHLHFEVRINGATVDPAGYV